MFANLFIHNLWFLNYSTIKSLYSQNSKENVGNSNHPTSKEFYLFWFFFITEN